MSFDDGFDLSQEPKKVFINLLIWDIKIIQGYIYMSNSLSSAVMPLMGLIDSLDEIAKKKLEPQYRKLEAMLKGETTIRQGDVEQIYREVLTYLHKTVLKEVAFAAPRYKTPKTAAGKLQEKSVPHAPQE